MELREPRTDLGPPSRAFFWGAFASAWVVLGLLPVAPSFQDGALSNLSPAILGWIAVAVDPSVAVGAGARVTVGLWLVAHLLASWLLAVALVRARRRLGAQPFRRRALAGTALVVCGGAMLVHVCWPDKIFFDAHVIYYDVSDLIRAGTDARFHDSEAIASLVRQHAAGRGPHYLPDTVVGAANEPTIIAWGSWIEHYQLRRELAALREP